TSLCGLSAGELIAGDSKFGFSHEVISDCFLSLALQRRCEAGIDKTYIINFFSKGAIHPAVVEWFVAGNSEAARNALNVLLPLESASPIWKKNVGSLWTALLDFDVGMPPHFSASGLAFQTIKLSRGHGNHLGMQNSSIDQLIVSKDATTVDVKSTTIRYLEVDATS
ncbi:NTPase, partial [Pseudomonas sp. MWU13-2625]